ncbi:MAG: response regulator, partial [Verrucomicrobia subdivision 3 bacterium]|nr:response regulator [Limisphaerales bacterium]
MPETRPPRILLVEDSLVVKRALENALRAAGCEVVTVTTASDALQAAFAQMPDLMILDLTLDAASFDTFRDGFAVLNWLRHMLRGANFPVIIHTGDPSPLVDERARAAGVFAVIRKGDPATDILNVVRQAFEQGGAVEPENSDEAGAA